MVYRHGILYTMSGHKQHKLNWLQHHLPEGLVADAAWFERQGYSRGLRQKYVANRWLNQVARGVYRRPSGSLDACGEQDRLRWQHVVISLQTLLERPFIVGGRTALELQGFAHYLAPAGPREIHLYGVGSLPRWLLNLELDSKFVFHNGSKLFKRGTYAQGGEAYSGEVPAEQATGVVQGSLIRQLWGHRDWPLIMSSPERAILELLDGVPQRETFHQADMLMEGLRNLSPRRLQQLLPDCRNVKVKRLFFWFAERHNHAWLNKLDRSGVDFGRGKRLLVRGGKLDRRYNITVPENLDGDL
jgi:hypothetical protein